MRKLALLVLVVGIAVVGSQAVSAQPGKGKVVASATGAGHVTQNAKLRTFSFTAREYADGTVKGQAQLRNRGESNTPIHVRVTCLNVVGDVAHMTGHVSKVRTPTTLIVVNSKVSFSVRDNGPTGDLVSQATFHGNVPALNCESTITTPTLVVEKGQVKVRP